MMGGDPSGVRHPMAASDAAEVVVRCSCRPLAPASLDRLRTVIDDTLDWPAVLRIARGNGTASLLHHTLSTPALSGVPEWVHDELEERRYATAASNRYRSTQLLDIFDRFEREGVRALPFKGPVLAEVAYGDLSLRTFGDIDILVDRNTFSTAVDVLEAAGFEWVRDAPRRDDAAVLGGPLTSPPCHEYQLRRASDGMLVEVRWRVGTRARRFGIGFDALWGRRRPVPLAGGSVPALGHGDRLLVLAHHGVRHYWERLAWISDLAALLEADRTTDWPTVFERARSAGTARQLRVGLALAATLRDEPLPANLRRSVRADDLIEALVSEVCRAFRTDPIRDVSGATQADRLYYFLRACDSVPDAFGSLFYAAPIQPQCVDYVQRPLPKWLFPAYYLSASSRTLSKSAAVGRLLVRSIRSAVERL